MICKAPEEVEYSIDFTYYIGASSKKNADIVKQKYLYQMISFAF